MKALLIVLVLALAGGGAYYFYFKDHPIALTQGPDRGTPVAAASATAGPPTTSTPAKKDFKDLSVTLQGDMDHIPANLRDSRQIPTHAFDIKARLVPYLTLHEEYKTLNQVCDLIIDVDQQFRAKQGMCGLISVDSTISPQERIRAANGLNIAVYQQQEPLWDSQRRQTDGRVRQLLASLENHRL